MSQKGSLQIFLILILIALGLGLFFYKNTANEGTEYRDGEAIGFSFSYPVGWSAYSTISEEIEIFRLNPDPIWSFPHSTAFVEGEGRELANEEDFDKAVEGFKADYTTRGLDWETQGLKSSCFEYDVDSAMWGKVTGSIKCFVQIKARGDIGIGSDGGYVLYTFDILNANQHIDKTDPDRSILMNFFSSLKEIRDINN